MGSQTTDQAKRRAEAFHQTGISRSDEGNEEAAIAAYLNALSIDPERPDTLYNLGLIYKYRRQWSQSFDYNRRAAELRPDDEATQWNLAIAATALRDWTTARAVWRVLNIFSKPGEGPIKSNFGSAPVRLNVDDPAGAAIEVVWSDRLCPVRSSITNIPTGETGFRYGDIVLHDGAGTGYRLDSNGNEREVFNVLELFEPSRFSTWEATVEANSPQSLDELVQRCEDAGIHIEDWTASMRNLCKACSEGRPHDNHDHDLPKSEEWLRGRRLGLAAVDADGVAEVLKGSRLKVSNLRCALDARLS